VSAEQRVTESFKLTHEIPSSGKCLSADIVNTSKTTLYRNKINTL